MKKNKIKKILGIVFGSIFAVIFVVISVFYGIFFNEVNALISIKKIDENVYTMSYKNDYFFDEFLKTGAKNDTEVGNFITKNVLHGLNINFAVPDYGCSSFVSKTENNDDCLSRNFDLEYDPILILKTQPKNAYKSISVVYMNSLGIHFDNLPNNLQNKFLCLATPYVPMDGVNECGVAINVNMAFDGTSINQNTDKISITSTTLIRLVLDYAKDCEEAVELIKQYDLNDSTGGPYHYQIADKTGKSAIVEYYNNEISVEWNYNNDKYRAMTNHLLIEQQMTNSSADTIVRYNTMIDNLNNNNNVLSETECMALLKDVQYDTTGWNGGTLYSVVYNLDKLTATVRYMCDDNKIYNFKI